MRNLSFFDILSSDKDNILFVLNFRFRNEYFIKK